MQARYIWVGCGYDSPVTGIVETATAVDCFWVTASKDEAEASISSLLDDVQKRRYLGGFKDRVDDWLSPGKDFAAFLIARDKSRVLSVNWEFPNTDPRASVMQAIGVIGEDGLPAGVTFTTLDDLASLAV